jgi:CheY-like chemotaxis protein
MGMQARTIAVIDDDLRVLESLINLLASCGYKAQGYSSAEQFLDSGGLQKSCCVITDVEMRQMSGLGLLHHINNTDSPLPRNPNRSTWRGEPSASSANRSTAMLSWICSKESARD